MSLIVDKLKPICELIALRSYAIPNEQAVIQSIVLPILGHLGWNFLNALEVHPQYSTNRGGAGTGRVDFALRIIKDETNMDEPPFVFIEVKNLGGLNEEAEKQVFDYAYGVGVPLLVLTDGDIWSFYNPQAAGKFADRKIEEISLRRAYNQADIDKAANTLQKFLSKSSMIHLISYRRFIQDEYDKAMKQRILLEIWSDFVSAKDQEFLEFVRQKIRRRTGLSDDDVPIDWIANSVREITGKNIVPPTQAIATPRAASSPSLPSPVAPSAPTSPQQRGFYFMGTFHPASSLGDLLVKVLSEIERNKPGFLERFYGSSENRGNKRTYLGKKPEELLSEEYRQRYPDWKKRVGYDELIDPTGSKWYVMTHVSTQAAKELCRKFCKVAGLPWENKEAGIYVVV
ncbi:MAG: hypothetical protein RML92_08760 [Bacteroidia bacterium]|nr:hypothetical protein [Bacteroidia bacterium]